MKHLEDEKKLLCDIFDMIEAHFGENVEIVLHDLQNEYEHSIVDIRNGNISNRKVGDCGAEDGLEVLSGADASSSFNEIMRTKDGKILRCSTMFIHNCHKQVVGSICINQDITKMVEIEKYLHKENRYNIEKAELLTTDVNTLLENLIRDATFFIGKDPSKMQKNDKIEFIRYLEKRGAFLITKSGPKICNYLNISKFTLYNYLDMIRNNTNINSKSKLKT